MCFSSKAPCQTCEQLQNLYIPSKKMEAGEIYGVLVYIMDGIFWLIDAGPLTTRTDSRNVHLRVQLGQL